MFFQNLTKKLDDTRRGWRSNTIMLLDNASYHNSSDALAMLKKYQIPVIFTGPHSYAAVPIELLFGAFKSKDINPRLVTTGKK